MTRPSTLSPSDTSEALRGSGFHHANGCLTATYRTPDFGTGARLVADVADVADALNHHPDVSLGWGAVVFSLTSHDAGGVTERDLELARRISQVAAALELSTEDTDGEGGEEPWPGE